MGSNFNPNQARPVIRILAGKVLRRTCHRHPRHSGLGQHPASRGFASQSRREPVFFSPVLARFFGAPSSRFSFQLNTCGWSSLAQPSKFSWQNAFCAKGVQMCPCLHRDLPQLQVLVGKQPSIVHTPQFTKRNDSNINVRRPGGPCAGCS